MRNSRMVPGVSFLTSRYRCIIGVSRGSSEGEDMDECRYGKVHRRGAEDAEKKPLELLSLRFGRLSGDIKVARFLDSLSIPAE